MTVELYFAPGACSFVPHVGLEIVRSATGRDFAPRLVKLQKGEHLTPEYKALNPDAQALSQLARMNNTVHPTFTHVFIPQKFAEGVMAAAPVAAAIERERVKLDTYKADA